MILGLIFSGDLRGGVRSWDRNFLCSCSVFYWEVGCEGFLLWLDSSNLVSRGGVGGTF